MLLGKSQRNKEPTRVASVAAFNPDGLLLFGVRNDSGKYTLPGGHFEPDEEPIEAARRELEEETGLKGENFEFLGVGEVKAGLHIYCFRCLVVGDPCGDEDPDEECSEWKWVEANDVPDDIMDNLHSKNNVTLRLLGIQEGDVEEPLEKKDIEASAPIPVQHYGAVSGLQELDPKFQGSGAAGAERNRPGRIPRTYYYTRPGATEGVVTASSPHLYHGELPSGTKLYDMAEDKLGLNQGRYKQTSQGLMYHAPDHDAVERKLKRLGYHGYHSFNSLAPDALAYFHKLPVQHIARKSEEGLQKGLPGLALAGALALGTGGARQAPAAPQAIQAAQPPAWSNVGLHPDLEPIAHLESSYGQNMAHASHSKGEFHTAFGALGMKPVTAHEEYTKSKYMNQQYPGLSSPESFLKTFKTDPKFYNLLASAHFSRLKARHGGPQQAAFAWRYGTGATANATPEQIQNDAYVQKYTHMNLHAKQGQETIQKAEDEVSENDPRAPIIAARKKQREREMLEKYRSLSDATAKKNFLATNHYDATPELLTEAYEDPDVRFFAVRAERFPVELMNRAINDEDQDVRSAAVAHSNIPPELLPQVFANGSDEHVRYSAVSKFYFPPEHLPATLNDPSNRIRERAIRHSSFPTSGLAEAFRNDNNFVKTIAVNRKDFPSALLPEAFESGDKGVREAAVANPKFPAELFPKALQDVDVGVREEAVSHPNFPPALVTEAFKNTWGPVRRKAVAHPDFPTNLLPEALQDESSGVRLQAIGHKDLPRELLPSVAINDEERGNRLAAARRPDFPPEALADTFTKASYSVREQLVGHPQFPPELFPGIIEEATKLGPAPGAHRLAVEALNHPNFPPELLPKASEGHNQTLARMAQEKHQQLSPDSYHDDSVGVKFGTNKLRQLRDEIDAAGGKVHKKDVPNLPPALTKLLDGKGYLASSAIQSAIDAMPATFHNISHTTWSGAQRHNNEQSNVLQLNLTNEHLNKMKEAGVLPTFHAINDLSRQSGHPVTPSTWGWVRYTGGENGVHIDEVQSDLGQSLVRRAAAEAAQAGVDPDEAASRAASKYPDQHLKKIQEILFSGKHPSEVLQEAFHQHLRDTGSAGVPIAIHAAATKAPLSGMDTDKPLPGHMLTGYKAVPEKMGLKPSNYGELDTQSNPDLLGKPTYEDKIRKTESKSETYYVLQHLGMVETPPKPLSSLHDRRAANTDPDPLEAVLQHENPRERILALKNKHVTPYHLRMALHDEDPEVRAFAARHPRMTEPLIHEALQHEDLHTRKAAMSRLDLTPEHIQSVLFDPDLQTMAAMHPRATQEQREMVAEHHQTPQGLKTELLAKTVGYLMYPRLGQNSVPSTPMIREPEAHGLAAAAGGGDLKAAMSRGFTRYNAGARGGVKPSTRHFSLGVKTGPGLLGSLGHETQHGIFAHLKQNYGKEATHRIIATTLTALDPKDHQHLKNLTDWAVNGYDPLKHPEERIAHLQNYLQDPMWRARAHRHMKILGHRNAEKASHDVAKQIWQKLRIRAQALTPQEVGVILKTEEDILRDWVELKKNDVQVAQLVKGEEEDLDYNVYLDQLGLKPKHDAYLKAAKFLARIEPDADLFRQSLLAGLDLDVAALTSVGLDADGANRRAIQAVIDIQDDRLTKAEPGEKFQVQALMPDGTQVAEAVQRGFDAGTQEDLHLGGRHSKGTMMVRDPDSGLMFILKPGSGNQSPALGAREENASQSRRETCFWHMAEAWGLGNRIPRADLLNVNGQEVAALHLLPFDWKSLEKLKFNDPALPYKALEKYRSTGELHKWATLDYILGNSDRHGQNLMVGPQDDGYPVALIDHGSAFSGPSFDPARDRNSFIPYYLRAWSGDSWKDLTPEQKLRAMPTIPRDTDAQLKTWLEGLHAGDLEQVLARYGIDPAPSMARLTRVKLLLTQDNLSRALNQLWLV